MIETFGDKYHYQAIKTACYIFASTSTYPIQKLHCSSIIHYLNHLDSGIRIYHLWPKSVNNWPGHSFEVSCAVIVSWNKDCVIILLQFKYCNTVMVNSAWQTWITIVQQFRSVANPREGFWCNGILSNLPIVHSPWPVWCNPLHTSYNPNVNHDLAIKGSRITVACP